MKAITAIFKGVLIEIFIHEPYTCESHKAFEDAANVTFRVTVSKAEVTQFTFGPQGTFAIIRQQSIW